MKKYVQQVLTDIEFATRRMNSVFPGVELTIRNWIRSEVEDAHAPLSRLNELTGISMEMLPPAVMLQESEIQELLLALKQMLAAYNCHFVLQMSVPDDIQYETIRQYLDQEVKVTPGQIGFFSFCKPGTPHKTCAMGDYCQCAFFEEFVVGK
jgi:hypothetical protein